MSDLIGFCIVVGVIIALINSRSKEKKQQEELEKIYAKLPEEDVKVLKKTLEDKRWQEQEDAKKWWRDPSYRSQAGNIYNDK